MQEKRTGFPNTYFVQNMTDGKEVERIALQDTVLTRAMGGVLPEQADPTRFRRIIDIGCGTGGWLIETARTYPGIQFLVGIDTNSSMITYAREQADAQQMSGRVEFQVMDALAHVQFPQHYFDLLNQRMGLSYLRTWDWSNTLTKYQYMTRPGGVIRITESAVFGTSDSPALTRLREMARDSFYNAGHLFTNEDDGVINKIPELFHNHGFTDVQTRAVTLEYRPGTEMMDAFVDDVRIVFRTILPFLQKWSQIPQNYDEIYQNALFEMQQPGCITTLPLLTVWGKTPK